MLIGLETLKRIAKAQPELTLAEFVTVWTEKIDDRKREKERERISNKRQQSRTFNGNNEPTNANGEQQPPTYLEQERELYRFAEQVCGKRVGSFTTTLLRANRNDIAATRAIFERAQQTNDPRAFIATAAGKVKNGTGHSDVSAAGERVIAAREERERTLDLEDYHDITERRG